MYHSFSGLKIRKYLRSLKSVYSAVFLQRVLEESIPLALRLLEAAHVPLLRLQSQVWQHRSSLLSPHQSL